MPAVTIANILSDNLDGQTISPSFVYSVKHDTGFKYLRPLYKFFTNEKQIQNRVTFCKHYIEKQTNFDNLLFTGESSFKLTASHKWLWRRRGETLPDVQCATKKVPKKSYDFWRHLQKLLLYTLLLLHAQSMLLHMNRMLRHNDDQLSL